MMRHLAVFAQVNPLDFGRNFRAAAAEDFQWINVVLVVLIFLAIGLAVSFAVRFASEADRRGYRSPRKLFRELCQAHHLDRASCLLLKRLAAAHSIAPTVLFLSPERFDISQLDASWVNDRSQLETIRDTIFGRRLNEVTAE